MKKYKIYIFIIHTVYTIGGTQMYVLGKARYLHERGWRVYTFLCDDDDDGVFHDSDEYMETIKDCFFLSEPPYRFKRGEQDMLIDQLLRSITVTKTRNRNVEDYIWDLSQPKIFNNAEVIVETCFPNHAFWGELLAARVGARHFFACVQENYRSYGNTYEDNLDFFYFKWKRNELIAAKLTIEKLFNGYKDIHDPVVEISDAIREQDAVQDVPNTKIEEISKADWNICHIGRIEKDYVPHVIKGIAELAERYPNKTINFVFVGDAEYRKDLLDKTFHDIPNVNLIFLGVLAPIPRILFSKLDVVCAISQSALFAANEGIFTVVASVNTPEKTPGLLGYETDESVFGEPTFSYFEVLENIFVKKIYDISKSKFKKLLPAEYYYDKFWTILKRAAPEKEYFVERLSQDRIRYWAAAFPFASVARGAKIIFYGATEIAKDYRNQIECQRFNFSMDVGLRPSKKEKPKPTSIEIGPNGVKKLDDQPYCQVLAVVDDHPENFDDSVVGIERLKTVDYDGIVMTVHSWEVRDAISKILEIVPQMADRIVYNHKFFNLYTDYHRSVKFFGLW